jgi:hypothetical protein
MRSIRSEEWHEDARAEAGRPVEAAHGADHHPPASIADLRFTLRVGLIAALTKLSLVAYALLGSSGAAPPS